MEIEETSFHLTTIRLMQQIRAMTFTESIKSVISQVMQQMEFKITSILNLLWT